MWIEEPIFCFTSDIDWASEAVLSDYFTQADHRGLKTTLFVTHKSQIIEEQFQNGVVNRGIHPNFLAGSSHGDSFEEVVKTCLAFAPEARGFRCHRLFDVTDITHLLRNKYGFKYVSNLGTLLKTNITPILHESGLLHYPIFFEDGAHSQSELDLDISKYSKYFSAPGIKIISFHPMNLVLNYPTTTYMRSINESLTREEYNNIDSNQIEKLRNTQTRGVGDSVKMIFELVDKNNYTIMSLDEIYKETIR